MSNEEFRKKLIQRALLLAQKVIQLVDTFPNKRSAWIISDQLIRATTSIGANIVEAQAASSKKDFINFLNHALKSANEAKFWLVLAKDIAPDKITRISQLENEVTELAKILGTSITTLKGKNKL